MEEIEKSRVDIKFPYIQIEDVYLAYKEARKHKSKSRSLILFEENLLTNLYDLYRDLITGTYNIGKSICFIVTRPKLREVFAADFRDRIVHHILINRLTPLFDKLFIRNTFSCIKKQ